MRPPFFTGSVGSTARCLFEDDDLTSSTGDAAAAFAMDVATEADDADLCVRLGQKRGLEGEIEESAPKRHKP